MPLFYELHIEFKNMPPKNDRICPSKNILHKPTPFTLLNGNANRFAEQEEKKNFYPEVFKRRPNFLLKLW